MMETPPPLPHSSSTSEAEADGLACLFLSIIYDGIKPNPLLFLYEMKAVVI